MLRRQSSPFGEAAATFGNQVLIPSGSGARFSSGWSRPSRGSSGRHGTTRHRECPRRAAVADLFGGSRTQALQGHGASTNAQPQAVLSGVGRGRAACRTGSIAPSGVTRLGRLASRRRSVHAIRNAAASALSGDGNAVEWLADYYAWTSNADRAVGSSEPASRNASRIVTGPRQRCLRVVAAMVQSHGLVPNGAALRSGAARCRSGRTSQRSRPAHCGHLFDASASIGGPW